MKQEIELPTRKLLKKKKKRLKLHRKGSETGVAETREYLPREKIDYQNQNKEE